MIVINANGTQINFDAAVILMDDDIREAIHAEGIDNEQEFFSEYERRHAEKYGEEWEPSKANPVW